MHRYERVRVLGRGSYGTAVLVRTLHHDGGPVPRHRVVKEVELLGMDEKRQNEALREAELLKSLAHPNIIAYEDALLYNGSLCIVMEYAEGGDLCGAISRRRHAGRRYHEREAIGIFAQLALAVEFVHARRVLHRDLKSQNVLLTSGGTPKLADFGIARVLLESERCAGTWIGTPHNIAPEMIDSRPYDFKVDIWGLGGLLYEMLALEVPFTAQSFAALAIKICTAEPRPVSAVYSSEVRSLLVRLLSKRPEDRPTASEVIALPHVRRGMSALRPGTEAEAVPLSVPPTPLLLQQLRTDCGVDCAVAANGLHDAGAGAAIVDAGRPGNSLMSRMLSRQPTPLSPKAFSSRAVPGSACCRRLSQEEEQVEEGPCESPKRARVACPLQPRSLNFNHDICAGAMERLPVSDADLADAGIHFSGCAESDGEYSPLKRWVIGSVDSTPDCREREFYRAPLSPHGFGGLGMSASATVLIRELERELELV